MVRKIYKENEKVLKNSAFIKDFFGFQRCIMSLCKEYDLRTFFGGMEAYHDGQRMASVLGLDTQFKFASGFVIGGSGKVCEIQHTQPLGCVLHACPLIRLPLRREYSSLGCAPCDADTMLHAYALARWIPS